MRERVCVCVCWERQKRAEDGMRMEDIMAEWKIKTLPYAFPVQALRSLQFYAGRIHWEVHFFIVIFVGSAYFFPCLQRQQPHWVPCASARMCTQTLRINRNYLWTQTAIKGLYAHILMFLSEHRERNVLRVYCTGLNARKKPREFLCRCCVRCCKEAIRGNE